MEHVCKTESCQYWFYTELQLKSETRKEEALEHQDRQFQAMFLACTVTTGSVLKASFTRLRRKARSPGRRIFVEVKLHAATSGVHVCASIIWM